MSKTNYKRLGDYIREVDVRNRDLKVTKLYGVNIQKEFMPSVANIIGTDLSKYKIVSYNQFGCKLMSVERDHKLPISLMKESQPAIMSSAYFVFEVIDENVLNPDYLFMQIKRPEFDRRLWFSTGGDVRGGATWDNLCDMPIIVPSIDQQRKIVAEYNAIQQRIKLNEQLIVKLEETAQAIYRKMFVDGIDKNNLPEGWRMGTLGEFGDIITGKTPSSDNPEDFGDDMLFITPGDFAVGCKFILNTERHLSAIGCERLKNKILPKGSVAVTCIGSDMGKVAIVFEPSITNQQINAIKVKENIYIDYLFYYLSSIKNELKAMALGSSTMPLLNKSDFEDINIIIPHYPCLNEFSKIMSKINKLSLCAIKEIYKLIEIQFLLLTNMEG